MSTAKSEVKSAVKSETAYRVKNGGEFIMLFPQGNAFLYPGAECVITEPVNKEQLKIWESMGVTVTEISQEEAASITSGILGIME